MRDSQLFLNRLANLAQALAVALEHAQKVEQEFLANSNPDLLNQFESSVTQVRIFASDWTDSSTVWNICSQRRPQGLTPPVPRDTASARHAINHANLSMRSMAPDDLQNVDWYSKQK